jgi:23S rRNA U2552 (ribose-2'-O)-methylase RlmE/FtsJ
MDIKIPGVDTYQQDVTEQDVVRKILAKHGVDKIDFIQSDMAANTIGVKDIDAMRSIGLLEETLWMYKELLKPN